MDLLAVIVDLLAVIVDMGIIDEPCFVAEAHFRQIFCFSTLSPQINYSIEMK